MSQFISEEAINASTSAMEKGYEQFWALTKAQLETLFPAAAKNIDDVAALNKANYEAVTKAGQAAAKAFKTLGQSIVAYNQEAFEDAVEGANAFFACKSFQEVVELQGKQAQANLDKALAQTAKVGELTTKATNETLEPVNAHVTKIFKDLTKSAKAAAAA